MDNSNVGAPSNDPIKELFGPPPPRRPIPSNTFSTLVKIFSISPDQNPFSEYSSYAKLPEYLKRFRDNLKNPPRLSSDDMHNDVVAPRGEEEAPNELAGSAIVESQKLSVHNEANNKGITEVICKDVSFSGWKLTMDELGRTTTNKTVDKLPSDEEGTSIGMAEVNNVHEELSGIERILMDESDDLCAVQLPDKEVNFDFLNDFSFILGTDVCVNNATTIEGSESGKMIVDGNVKEDVAGEKRREDVEVNRTTSGGVEVKSLAHPSVVGEISDCREVVNQNVGTCPGEPQRKKRKLCQEKVPQNSSKFGDLTFGAQKSNNVEGTVSNSIMKEKKVASATKGKTKKAKDTFAKDVNSGKSKLLSMDGETSYNMKPGGTDPVVCGKMMKQTVYGNTGKFTARKVGNNQPKICDRIQYSREELLNLKKMTSVPEDIQKILQEIAAEMHGKCQNAAAGKRTDAGVANKEKLDAPTKNKLANEEGSSIPKSKKRGSSSEARKEKKKQQRRKKRAEMNKKLGVKRLKLKPIVKPKVISPCRHYLKGRCQEGEKCKFSHDVIPLTKSKPCCHFARQACMKGNDCPFDHQLSDYPCNSYLSTGFCSRGDSCLFSHKISVKEGSETAANVSKCETTLDQLDKSKSEQQLKANASFSAGISTPEALKENLVMQTSRPVKAPKGLSFLSSGKSTLKDSSNHIEADLFQKSGAAVGTSSQSSIATTAADLVKALTDSSASDTPLATDFISFVQTSVDNSRSKKQASPSLHRDYSSFYSFGKSEEVESSQRSNNTAGISNQLNKGTSSRLQSVCGMLEANPAPVSPKQFIVPSTGVLSYDDHGGKLPTNGHPDSRIREKDSVNGSENAIPQKLWGSPTSGQNSSKLGVKNTPSTAERALSSALAFAAKHESGIKLTSAASVKEVSPVTKNEGTSSGSGSRQNEPSKAAAILEFLYSGGNKQK